MARINTNVPAVVAQRNLAVNQRALSQSLQRLSTGLRINRGADDPAGLINSENLRAEIAGVGKAIDNSNRAINIVATTEGALNEVASLLTDIQGLIVESANTGAESPDEIKANQLQIDSAIASITRISNTSTFAGRKLLDGSLDYVTSGVNTSSAVSSLQVHGAQFGTASYIPVKVVLTASAQKGYLQFRGSSLASSVSFELKGNRGATTISLGAGTTASAVVAAVNQQSEATGVEADFITASNPASGVVFRSVGYGSDQFVEIHDLPGNPHFNIVDSSGTQKSREVGVDAQATINGQQSIGHGLDLTLNTATLDLSLRLKPTFPITSTSFAITGGGALFQLGPQVSPNQQVNFGVQSVSATRLGNTEIGFLAQVATGGAYSVTGGQTAQASDIVTYAINQISTLRGRLGAFERNTLQTNINSLSITSENLTASESAIRDTDFAAETSALTRNQILVNAGTSVLALANSTPQSVLSLLQGR